MRPLTNAQAISLLACRCIKAHTTARDVLASAWKAAGGTGPLKPHREALGAEMERQRKIRNKRGSAGLTNDPLKHGKYRRSRQLADLRAHRHRLMMALPFEDLTRNEQGAYRIDDLLIEVEQRTNTDWNYYARSYRYPRVTRETTIRIQYEVQKQIVTYATITPRLLGLQKHALNAIGDHFDETEHAGKIALRTSPYVALHQIDTTIRGAKVFARRIAGRFIDYVATYRGAHYHALNDPSLAADGVRRKVAIARLAKIGKRSAQLAPYVTGERVKAWPLLRGLGFCDAGISDALAILGIVAEEIGNHELDQISPDRIREALDKYPQEARTLAEAIGTEELRRSFPTIAEQFAELIAD